MTAVYFVQEMGGGPVKIGRTSSAQMIRNRLVSLQCGNPRQLVVAGAILDVPPFTEASVHGTFAARRIRGEWFEPHEDMRRFAPDILVSDENAEPVAVPGFYDRVEGVSWPEIIGGLA